MLYRQGIKDPFYFNEYHEEDFFSGLQLTRRQGCGLAVVKKAILVRAGLSLHLLSPMPLNYLLTSDDTVNVPHLCKDTIWTKMQEKCVKVLDKELRCSEDRTIGCMLTESRPSACPLHLPTLCQSHHIFS